MRQDKIRLIKVVYDVLRRYHKQDLKLAKEIVEELQGYHLAASLEESE